MHPIGRFYWYQISAFISGLQKGPAERGHVKNRQKVSKSFSTLFDNFRAGQKTSKIVKKCQKVSRHFSTIFAQGKFFPAPSGELRFYPGQTPESLRCEKFLLSNLRQSSNQPPDWKSSWRDFSEVRGSSGGSFRKGT